MFRTILKNNYKVEDVNELREVKDYYFDCEKVFENRTHAVAMKAIVGDFGPEELADMVDIAEKLFDTLEKPVILCLAMDRNNRVTVKQMPIKSHADFTIKLAVLDMYKIALETIREKIANGTADDADRQVLEMMPMTVHDDVRKEVRKECFELLNAF